MGNRSVVKCHICVQIKYDIAGNHASEIMQERQIARVLIRGFCVTGGCI